MLTLTPTYGHLPYTHHITPTPTIIHGYLRGMQWQNLMEHKEVVS